VVARHQPILVRHALGSYPVHVERGALTQLPRFLSDTFPDRRLAIITDDTVVCRCEEVTAGQVKAALVVGDPSVRGVKIRTRAGMGLCQGRMCGSLIRQLISRETRTPMSEIRLDTPRPPVKPIPIGALLSSSADF